MGAVLSSPPDGYTLGFVAPNNAINATLYEKLLFDFIRDSAPIGGTMLLTNVLVVHPSVPAKNVAEFIEYVKANPGKVSFASSGTGASPHMSAELFMAMAGIKMTHVPYRGGAPAMNDLLPGRVQLLFDNLPGSIAHIKAGSLRALGVTAAKRSATLPDVPTIGETVPGYEVSVWNGIPHWPVFGVPLPLLPRGDRIRRPRVAPVSFVGRGHSVAGQADIRPKAAASHFDPSLPLPEAFCCAAQRRLRCGRLRSSAAERAT